MKRLALLPLALLLLLPLAHASGQDAQAPADGGGAGLTALGDQLKSAEIKEEAAQKPAAKGSGFGGVTPCSGTVRKNYLQVRPKHKHSGIDIYAKKGAPILALGDGVVVSAGWDDSYGKTVLIKHTLASGQVLYTRYAHLLTCDIKPGAKVARGEKIPGCAVDNSGRSYGDHLHFEVRVNPGYGVNGTKNPIDYLQKTVN